MSEDRPIPPQDANSPETHGAAGEAEDLSPAPQLPADEQAASVIDNPLHVLRSIWKEAVIITVATVLLTVVHYQAAQPWLDPRLQLFGWQAANVVLLFFVPVLLIRLVFREPLRAFGFQWGNAAVWSRYVLVFCVLFIPVAVIASRIPDFNAYYPRYPWAREDPWLLIPVAAGWAAYFFAWEFFYRGFLLMGLGRRFGPIAIFIQMVPFTMTHYPKLELESLAAIFAGILLGWMAWRGRSFVGAWIVHWVAALSMDLLVVFWPLH